MIGAHVGARGAGADPDVTQNADAAIGQAMGGLGNPVAGTDGAGGGVNEHAAPAEVFVPGAGIGVGSGEGSADAHSPDAIDGAGAPAAAAPTAPQDVHIGDRIKNNRPRIRVVPRARPPDNVAPVMVPTLREHRGESEAPPAKRSKKECHDEDKALPGTRSKAPSACASSTRPRRPSINQAYVLLPFFSRETNSLFVKLDLDGVIG